MRLSEVLMNTMLALAIFAALILGLVWIAFTCRELWQMHTLARSRRARGIAPIDSGTAPFER